MIVLKAIGIISAAAVAMLASLFVIASGLAANTLDPVERRMAAETVLGGLITIAVCAAIILSLSGCQAARTIADTCRDGLCR
jgi:hypothetical protein